MKGMPDKEYEQLVRQGDVLPDDYSRQINTVLLISNEDVEGLHESEQNYGDSWKQRGGVGAFMMLARKWDRIEKQVKEGGYDVFKLAIADERDEGIIDDIRDLRRYLFLVESEIRLQKHDGKK
jgi:hypothetical protein|tara:strand:- start:103 stop:471 length:369 start_codon:yes stop_codon:yes gene_type:complete